MKVMKWICRYAFFALLLAGCIFWCIYCSTTIAELEATVYSLDYIDLAVSLAPEALELLDRIAQFEELLDTAILATVIVGVCLLLLIIYHVVSTTLMKKKAARCVSASPVIPQTPVIPEVPVASAEVTVEPEAERIEVSAPAEAVSEGVSCSQCGQYYEKRPIFCVRCGHKFE